MDILLVFLAVLLAYAYLRSHGGKGLSIAAYKLPPASTAAGKRERIFGSIVLVAIVLVAINGFLHQRGTWNRLTLVVAPVVLGALVTLMSFFNQRKGKH